MRIGTPLARRSKYNATRNHPPQGAANISLTNANPKVSRIVLETQAGKLASPFTGVSYPVVSNTLQEITSTVRFKDGVTPLTEINLAFGFGNNGDITSNPTYGITLDVSATASLKGGPEEPAKIFTDTPKGDNAVSQITLSYKSPQASEIQQPAFRNSDTFAINVSQLAPLVAPANQALIAVPEPILQGGATLTILTQITFHSSLTDGILTQNVKWTLNILPQGIGDGEEGEEGGKGEKP
jgi:hypothetical protein